MKRKKLKTVLSVMALLMALNILAGCTHATKAGVLPLAPAPAPPPLPGDVTILIHGPLVTVVSTPAKKQGPIAFSPWQADHVGVMGRSTAAERPATDGGCPVRIKVELQGVQNPQGQTAIGELDQQGKNTLEKITIERSAWQRTGAEDDLVVFDADAPPVSIRAIAETSDATTMRFAGKPDEDVKLPTTLALTFQASDLSKVVLKRTDSRNCQNAKDSTTKVVVAPLVTCKVKAGGQYIRVLAGNEQASPGASAEVRDCLSTDRYAYFIGTGISPNAFPPGDNEGPAKHARDFFNEKLLCAVYGSCKDVPPEKKMISNLYFRSSTGQRWALPQMVHALFRYAPPPFLSTENCAVPPVIVKVK